MTTYRELGFGSYQEYLESAHWERVKQQYRQSGRDQACIHCGDPVFELHHLTYDRLGRESLDDLVPLCRQHHAAVEGMKPATPQDDGLGSGKTLGSLLLARGGSPDEAVGRVWRIHREILSRVRKSPWRRSRADRLLVELNALFAEQKEWSDEAVARCDRIDRALGWAPDTYRNELGDADLVRNLSERLGESWIAIMVWTEKQGLSLDLAPDVAAQSRYAGSSSAD